MRGAQKQKLPRYLKRQQIFGSPLLRTPRAEALRLAFLSVIRAHWGADVDEAEKLELVENALLGRWGREGPKGHDLDDVFMELARRVSIEDASDGPKSSVTSIARSVLSEHPRYAGLAQMESIVRDVVRKFGNHRTRLLELYGVGAEAQPIPYDLVREALTLFEKFGLDVDWDVLPRSEQGEISA